MKRFTTLLNRSKSHDNQPSYNLSSASADSPEANAVRAINSFCESGADSNGGEEVLHLPVIVEAAESSPSASAASAQTIARLLGREWSTKPHVQYNAVMVLRILSDHPGPPFTRNFDKPFVRTIKELLRSCRDQSTQQIMRETLDSLEVNKGHDEGLQGLIQMWRKEKGGPASLGQSRSVRPAPSQQQQPYQQMGEPWQQQQQYSHPVHTNGSQQYGEAQRSSARQLPSPQELASRIEEARNTAKILMQLIMSTPQNEVLANELIKEFNERCQGASKSMQNYISADDPSPDDNTLQTLIETNEQLSLATNRYQRAVLASRRAMGSGSSPNMEAAPNSQGGYMPATPEPQPQSLFQAPPSGLQGEAHVNGTSLFGQAQQQLQSHIGQKPLPPVGPLQSSTYGQQQYQVSPQPSPQLSPPLLHEQTFQPASRGPRTVPFSDPFVDPFEHDSNAAPSVAVEDKRSSSYQYGSPDQRQSHPNQSHDFSSGLHRRTTFEHENAYSPDRHSSIPSVTSPVNNAPSPTTQRPGPGAWHNSTVTPSFLGRQASAADGLTMHGAQSNDNVAELDNHSQVGRKERDRAPATTMSVVADGGARESWVSPDDVGREARRSRVDVGGTGGFRSSLSARK
ncbi:hypothetical protein LTR62_007954 [Meristemomyces frigidus]|uniref:GAT domain-containing protein n=1 Tax=Meristemomyces frigidus TaxID=1508187 RepID=A0AAN7TUT0_9PEZI|nr:hypothetical protein LTR62_007954 [Meristemomyces frigidus]